MHPIARLLDIDSRLNLQLFPGKLASQMKAISLLSNITKNALFPLVHKAFPGRAVLGLEGHEHLLLETLNRIGSLVSGVPLKLNGTSVCELGPGRSPQLMMAFSLAGAKEVVALDTKKWMLDGYFDSQVFQRVVDVLLDQKNCNFLDSCRCSAVEASQRRDSPSELVLRYELFSGFEIAAPDNSYGFMYSKSVLEHIKHGYLLDAVREHYRVLEEGGYALHIIDLRDHQHIIGDDRVIGDWLEALQYPEWLHNAMTSQRPAYINRIRANGWRRIFEQSGFEIVSWSLRHNELPREFDRELLAGEFKGAEEDFSVSWVYVLLQKPAQRRMAT